MSNNYLVYKHTSPSGKMYIGITDNYQRRSYQHQYKAKRGSSLVFHNAIRKYGWDSFKHEIIVENISRDEACLIEVLMIKELDTYAPNGYNLTAGGAIMDSESNRKVHIANRGKDVKCYVWSERNQSYSVQFTYLGKMLHFGGHKNESDAANKASYLMSLSDEELIKAAEEYRVGKSTRTKGYCFNKREGKYMVRLTIDGKQKHFGYFKEEADAIERVAQLRNEF